jgi:hypothetical protein
MLQGKIWEAEIEVKEMQERKCKKKLVSLEVMQ